MAKEAAAQIQVPRERHLNIVYFVDSSRTHSIRINLVYARWIVAIAVGLTLWSMISLAWIVSLDRILAGTRERLSIALSSVFDYQVKYDKVFDVAYPDASLQGYYAEGSHLPVNNPTSTEEKEKPVERVAPESKSQVAAANPATANTGASASAATVAVNKAPADQAQPKSDAAAAPSKSGALEIKKPQLTKSGDKLTLEFDMINRDVKSKSEGYVWATLALHLPDGTTKTLVAPTVARLNKAGTLENPTSAYRFSIQRFKKKDFSFAVPSADGWTVSDVKIIYTDLKVKERFETSASPELRKAGTDQTKDDDSETSNQEKEPSP